METDDGKGRGVGTSSTARPRSGASHPPGARHAVLQPRRQRHRARAPDRLAGVRPQERVQRHAVQQIGDSAPFLPSLDVPVLLMGEQLVEVSKLLDVAVPEQVLEVPKIFVDDIPPRLSAREPTAGGTVGGSADAVPCSPSCAAYGRPAGGSAADRASRCPAVVSRGCGWTLLGADLWIYGGLLVEGGHLPHPVDLPIGVYRQARAGYEYWPGMIVDVPSIMQSSCSSSPSRTCSRAIQFS